MITLRLSLPEAVLLRHLLSAQETNAAALLAKLDAAQQEAIRQRVCPVCGSVFTQLKGGRSARYCSAACKQKAYRQRRKQALRSHYPPPHPEPFD
jgi:NADH pyrophosphatase NudC (nudix superfamily)